MAGSRERAPHDYCTIHSLKYLFLRSVFAICMYIHCSYFIMLFFGMGFQIQIGLARYPNHVVWESFVDCIRK